MAEAVKRKAKLLSQGKPTSSSRTGWSGSSGRAVDGNTSGRYGSNSCTHTHSDQGAWWEVDLGAEYVIHEVKIWNRIDCCQSRLNHISVMAGNTECAAITSFGSSQERTVGCNKIRASRVRIKHTNKDYLTLCEVQVIGSEMEEEKLEEQQDDEEELLSLAGRNLTDAGNSDPLQTALLSEQSKTEGVATAAGGWSCG